jgi:sigma-B regulation protein RsbU (phosphoserine phosphatase)
LFFEEDKTSFDIHQQELFKSAGLVFSSVLNNALEHQQKEEQIQHLNTYYTISSMLNEIVDLRELLRYVINISTDALLAEAGSVLLLDESKKQLEFYVVEGEKEEVLLKSKFPADQGIAGWVIKNRKPIVVNNLQQDPRFYKGIDERSGFQSQSMVVAPLIANEEILGVIEVLNKVDQSDFTSEDAEFLASIADEAAFAIKNSILFEYLVNFYCRRRQGFSDCKGCKKPLSSWTPCAKMLEQEQG